MQKKRFDQNQIRADEKGKSPVRSSFFKKLAQSPYTKTAAIFALVTLHFVAQFTFFQTEKSAPKTEAINQPGIQINPENKLNVEILANYEAKKPAAVEMPKILEPAAQPEPKVAPLRTVIKKKESRESKAERLRRAERILTGV